jgi:hypothetical protein
MEYEQREVMAEDISVVLTDRAVKNLENMLHHIWAKQSELGLHDEHVNDMKSSLIAVLMTIFRFPGRVMAEDDLSLIIDSYITLGCIYHKSSDTWSVHS